MREINLLRGLLTKSLAIRHKSRLNSLLKPVQSILKGGILSLTGIARRMEGPAKRKHKIKSVNYLLGNTALRLERVAIYKALVGVLFSSLSEAIILVDWSPCINKEVQILRASIVQKGRAVTLYEEVHPESKLGNYQVHQNFLATLKTIVPEGLPITVVTDAGFRTEWFNLVVKMGWHFVGRVRSNMKYRKQDSDVWEDCLSTYESATGKPTLHGEVYLSKRSQLPCAMYLYKGRKNQKKPNKKQKMSTQDKAYRQSEHDPWLIVTSHPVSNDAAGQVINIYRKRMKIEHDFRDTKNIKFGLGLSATLTVDPERLEILLLIGFLATFLLWLVGVVTEHQGKQYDYQANTVRNRRVLSLVYLGLQVILEETEKITLKQALEALNYRGAET